MFYLLQPFILQVYNSSHTFALGKFSEYPIPDIYDSFLGIFGILVFY